MTTPITVTDSGSGSDRSTTLGLYGRTVVADGPQIYLPMLETAGTIAYDASGNNNNATLNGTITLAQAGPLVRQPSGGFLLDGSSGYIALPTGVTTNGLSAFSVELWFLYASALNRDARIVANDHTDANNLGFQFVVNTSGNTGFFDVGYSSGNDNLFYGSLGTTTATWYHYVAVYAGSSLTVYLNAVVKSTGGGTSHTVANAGSPINIGRNPNYNGDYFSGSVSNFAFYTFGLSQTQVQNHFGASLGVVPVGITEAGTGSDLYALNFTVPADSATGGGELIKVTLPPTTIPFQIRQATGGSMLRDTSLVQGYANLNPVDSATLSDVVTLGIVAPSVSDTASGGDSESTAWIGYSGDLRLRNTPVGGSVRGNFALRGALSTLLADAASGSDAVSITAFTNAPAVSDAASGSDGASIAQVAVAATDSATLTDQVTLTPTITLGVGDTASGSDAAAVANPPSDTPIPLSITDTASGSDAAALGQIGVTVNDTASGSDQVANTPTIAVGVSDGGTGTDQAVVGSPAIAVPLGDSASGSDAAALGQIGTAVSDAASGSDQVANTSTIAVGVGDSGLGVDQPATSGLAVAPALSESGTGSEVVSVTPFGPPQSDSASGSDVPTLGTVAPVILDSATGGDAAAIGPAISDTASGSDTNALAATTRDSATLSEAVAVTAKTILVFYGP